MHLTCEPEHAERKNGVTLSSTYQTQGVKGKFGKVQCVGCSKGLKRLSAITSPLCHISAARSTFLGLIPTLLFLQPPPFRELCCFSFVKQFHFIAMLLTCGGPQEVLCYAAEQLGNGRTEDIPSSE